jgi:hypothetical protein
VWAFRGRGWGLACEVTPDEGPTASPLFLSMFREGASRMNRGLSGQDLVDNLIDEVIAAVGRGDAPTGSREVQRWLAAHCDPLLLASVRFVQQPGPVEEWVAVRLVRDAPVRETEMSVQLLPVYVRIGAAVLVAACLNPEVCPEVAQDHSWSPPSGSASPPR